MLGAQKNARRSGPNPKSPPRLAAREATTTHILISGREIVCSTKLPRLRPWRNHDGTPAARRRASA